MAAGSRNRMKKGFNNIFPHSYARQIEIRIVYWKTIHYSKNKHHSIDSSIWIWLVYRIRSNLNVYYMVTEAYSSRWDECTLARQIKLIIRAYKSCLVWLKSALNTMFLFLSVFIVIWIKIWNSVKVDLPFLDLPRKISNRCEWSIVRVWTPSHMYVSAVSLALCRASGSHMWVFLVFHSLRNERIALCTAHKHWHALN